MSEVVKLSAYVMDGHTVGIRPAPLEREWMEMSRERFAYRCLPLNIANAYGWEILSPHGFTAVWNGSAEIDGIRVEPDKGTAGSMATSHFGGGVLTFHVPCLFRTSPGYDLLVQGPINRPKDGIQALTGVVETDWSPYTFTMNWIFTRSSLPIRFEKDEPFCHIFPVRRGELDAMQPEMHVLSDDPDLKREYELWTASRQKFNADLKEPLSEARAAGWQKLYYRGVGPGGTTTGPADHRTRLRLKPFAKMS